MKETPIEHIRHSLSHLLAAAVLEHYPGAKLTLGPAIDNGFYYDISFEKNISDTELLKIEETMRKLLPTFKAVTCDMKSPDEARAFFKGNEFKLELIEEIIARGEEISFYTIGNFTDLCQGGHAPDLSTIDPYSFKLDKLAGAYWRGSEKNPMLTRIYGLAFTTKEELEKYEWQLEEAKKRDHRIIGKDMKLFSFSDLIGSGLPLLQPKGMLIREEIESYLWELHKDKGYSRVWTPHIAKEALYETSGHASKFGDELFRVQGKEEKFFMKPMNCPHHMQIFADNQFSYRDMPIRYFEPATIYRDEKKGQLSGLMRVRSITQDDGHLFCRMSQIRDEATTIVNIVKEFYTTMGMFDGYWVRLSIRGDDKSLYIGSDENWETAEKILEDVAKQNNLNYRPGPGEAAFYGPKLDFMFQDAIGREWQLATIQCDFNLPERFDLSFINEKGEKERPVVIHRAISGSLERFMGVMIEHYAGAFPVWLSPLQVAILPVGDMHRDYAQEVLTQLKKEGVRVELWADDGLGKRVRKAKVEKVPYQIIIGDKERDAKTVTVEGRNDLKLEQTSLASFVERITSEIKDRKDN